MVDLRSLLDAPSPAVLAVYRPAGDVVLAPVWFRVEQEMVEVVIAAADSKIDYLRDDPRCVLMIFETTPPFRGVRIRGEVELVPDEGASTRLAIASRYLGAEAGKKYADPRVRPPGYVLRLPLADATSWDLSASLP